jgi:hypothetical protein
LVGKYIPPKTYLQEVKFEVFTAGKIQIEFFWAAMPLVLQEDTNVSDELADSIFRMK